MKKFFSSLLLSSLLLANAQAGFGIAAGATAAKIIAEYNGRNIEEKVVPYVATGVGIMFLSGIVVAITNRGDVFGPWGYIFFLDANGNLPQEHISATLQKAYPFLDNQLVINNLSQAMKKKYEATKVNFVSLDENEVATILAPADLSSEEGQLIIDDLK